MPKVKSRLFEYSISRIDLIMHAESMGVNCKLRQKSRKMNKAIYLLDNHTLEKCQYLIVDFKE